MKRQPYLWVVEMRDEGSGKWEASVFVGLVKADGARALKEARENDGFSLRLRRYVRARRRNRA